MNDRNDYNFNYDYETYKMEDEEEEDFTSPYHPKEIEKENKKTKDKKKNKEGGSHLLTIIQISVCTIVLAVFALLKAIGGDAYTNVKNWYLQNINNSIVAQEQINSIKESFLHVFQSSSSVSSDSSSQAGSSSESTSSKTVQGTSVLVSTPAATATKSIYSQVPVSLSVLLTPPVQNGIVTSSYGWRNGAFHKGMDISAPTGTKICSALPGKVKTCTQNSSYGNYVIVDHGNNIETLYAHCSSISVKSGDTVKYGQQIACVGSTGDSDGSHLHFELLIHEINYDPQPMLKARYV
jgi:murein DD-endopeptidase MepM/ murein hydrolase activator NlpD